ncbi:MAG: response regulator [Noviherbaspirillum sp.]
MMFHKYISLHVGLGTALSAVILLLAMILAGTLGDMAKREIASLAATNLESASQQMARELSVGMDIFSRDIEAQASRRIFRDPAVPRAEVQVALDQFVASHPAYAYVALIDAQSGTVLSASGGIFEGSSAAGQPVFEEGRKGLFVGDVHDAPRLAELMPRGPLGKPMRFLDAAAPVRDNSGHVTRVLAAHVGWRWTDSLRTIILGPIRHRRGIELLIVDSDNRLVLAPGVMPFGSALDQVARPVPGATTKVAAWTDGADFLTVMTPTMPHGQFRGFGWKVVARLPVKAAFAPVAMLQRGFFAGALALGLLAAAVAWFVTGRLLRPARQDPWAPGSPNALPEGLRRPGEAAQMEQLLHRLAGDSQTLSPAAPMQAPEFFTLLESLPHVVWQADAEGCIEYANAQWQVTFGPAAPGRIDALASLAHQADLPGFMAAWSGSRSSGADLHCMLRLRTFPDRAHLWFCVLGRALRDQDQRVLRWVGTITNVHDAIVQTERAAQALETERRARAEAERAALMAEDFLATLSHELRTPLNAISGWAELLARRAGDGETEARAAEVINRNVRLQAALLDDLINTSAIIAGKVTLDIKPFDAAALLAGVALSQKPEAERRSVHFACSAPGPMRIAGDERRISQAVTNLVSNAIKFTGAGGRVALMASLEGGFLNISLSDSGCGTAAPSLSHDFDRGRQEASSAARGNGGLGLATAAGLVRLHGGVIEAHSDGAGQGSRFTIRLPALSDAAESVVSDHTEQLLQQFPISPLTGLRILVTDDDEDARLATQALLASFGAHVTVSPSGSETLRLLDRQTFDLLLCDIGMPGMSGHDLMRAIRKRPRDKGALTPAIALTAFAMASDQRASTYAGFDAHVNKPLSAQTLIETICSVCEVGNAR